MSVAPSVVLPRRTVARSAAAAGPRRLTLLFAVLVVTSASAFALSLVSFLKPVGASDGLPAFADVAPMRGYVWSFFIAAGVQLIVGACAAALAVWLLVPRRGARWATVGGSLVWLGAALYGVGIGGWAAIYYFGTDAGTLGPATASRFIDHVNDDTARILAVPIGGAVLIALGTLLLAVALWRARTVPRWVPIMGAVAALATVVLPPDGVAGLIAEAASSATTIAIGWYVWQPRREAASA